MVLFSNQSSTSVMVGNGKERSRRNLNGSRVIRRARRSRELNLNFYWT